MATVVITPDALRQVAALPRTVKDRMLRLAGRLKQWPDVSGAKPLRGPLAGCFRLRTGDYRMQFRVKGDTVTIEKVGHRDGFYDD